MQKGITPVIAIVLLLLITISIAGVSFVFFGRSVESTSAAGEQQVQQQVSQANVRFAIESVDNNRVYMRNSGSGNLQAGSLSFYVNNVKIDTDNPSIAPGIVGVVTLDPVQLAGMPSVAEVKVSGGGFSDSITASNIGPGGTTVTITALDTTGGIYTSIAAGTDGLPAISYLQSAGGPLKVAKCGNAACSSGNTVNVVDSGGNIQDQTSLAIGAGNSPVIAYTYDLPGADLKVAKCGDAACSAGNNVATVDSAGLIRYHKSIAVAGGLPVIAYNDETNEVIKVAKCGDAACTTATINAVIVTEANVAHPSIAIGSNGFPVIAYQNEGVFHLKAVKCGNADCSLSTVKTVDTVAGNAETAIAVGSDGLPVISYQDSASADLKVAKCGDAECSSGNTITTLDSAGDVGKFSSIAVVADLPVVSYYDATNADLKVAKCGNAACTAATITVIDSAGDVGRHTSIAIGADGLPVISYYDATNADLKVAKCGNAACIP